MNVPSETISLFFLRRGLGVCSTYHLFCGLDQHRNWMRKLFAKKESQNSDNTKPAPQLLDTFLRFWKKDAAVTDKRTDVWSRDFIIWKIHFGLWAVVWAGLWNKRVGADYENLLRPIFVSIYGQKFNVFLVFFLKIF